MPSQKSLGQASYELGPKATNREIHERADQIEHRQAMESNRRRCNTRSYRNDWRSDSSWDWDYDGYNDHS